MVFLLDDFRKKELEEIEIILKLVEKQKRYHLSQTNITEREDLSQELDLLMFEKLQIFLRKPSLSFSEYIEENLKE